MKAFRNAEKAQAMEAKRAAPSCTPVQGTVNANVCEAIPIHSDGDLPEDNTLLTATTLLAGTTVFREGMQDQSPPAVCPKVEVEVIA